MLLLLLLLLLVQRRRRQLRLASGRYPLHKCLWGRLHGWSLHDLLRDPEVKFLSMVCSDVEIEPVLQDISGEQLKRGSNKAQDARLDIQARGRVLWAPEFFDVRVCHPNAVSYRDLGPQQIYRIHENKKNRFYSRRVLDIEHGTFTPLVFTTKKNKKKSHWHGPAFLDYREFEISPSGTKCNWFGGKINEELERWTSRLHCGQTMGTVIIKRGIFQGDSPSPLLFVAELSRAKRAAKKKVSKKRRKWVRKWSNLPIRENLVNTWPYASPPDRPSAPQVC